jgi:hypothetical protein
MKDYLSPLRPFFSGALSVLSFRFLARTAARDLPPAAARFDLGIGSIGLSFDWRDQADTWLTTDISRPH